MREPLFSPVPRGASFGVILACTVALALTTGTLSASEEDSVGFVRLTTTPAEDTLAWSNANRFKTVPLRERDKFCGSVASASGSTITVSNTPAWSTGELVYLANLQPRTYFVEITSGSNTGQKFQIVSNTANSITVDLDGGSLAGLAAEDEIRIGSYWTLNLLFPDGGTLTPSNSDITGTQVIFPASALDGPAFSGSARFVFRGDLGFWVDESAPTIDAGDVVIPHNALLVIRQDSATPVQAHFKGFFAKTGEGLQATISYAVPEPEITVEQPVGTALADGATPKDFGAIAVGANAQLTFTVRNEGAADLTGLAVAIDGPDSGDFSAGPLGATLLPAGQSTTFTLTFAPSATGSRSANDSCRPAMTATKTPSISTSPATVSPPKLKSRDRSPTPLTDGSDTVGFGTIDVGAASQQTFMIRNSGTTTLTNLSASIDGLNAADFIPSSPGATQLNPGESTALTVTFTPSASGGRSAALHIFSNDADENPFDIALAGNGSEQPVDPGPGRVDLPGDVGIIPGANPIGWLEAAAGKYAGLVTNADSHPAGWFSASKVSSTGAFSAKFSINGVNYSIKGVLDDATGSFSGAVTDKSGVDYARGNRPGRKRGRLPAFRDHRRRW